MPARAHALRLLVPRIGLLAALVGAAACVSPAAEAPPPQPAGEAVVIQHVAQRRDFVGPQPPRFAWSAVPDADHYAIGVWNEVDRLLWRRDDLTANSVDRPAELDLDDGTYFWTVSALKNGREIGKSGLAAFVVER